MVIVWTISTPRTHEPRRIRASTRVSGSAHPGWIYTRIPDSTQRKASSGVCTFLAYSISHDISSGPLVILFRLERQLPLEVGPRPPVRSRLRHSKSLDQRTAPATAAFPVRRTLLPGVPKPLPS